MAKFNIQHPLSLLGRRVKGVAVWNGYTYPFDGIVECVAVKPSTSKRFPYQVEFCVEGQDFIDVQDLTSFDYVA